MKHAVTGGSEYPDSFAKVPVKDPFSLRHFILQGTFVLGVPYHQKVYADNYT